MFKILLGGSPCTFWSIAQKNNREIEPSGMGWELFKNFLIARDKFKPDFFLYENNKSAAQPIKDQIAEELGVGVNPKARLTYINSALVSAQNRHRFYVTNFGDIPQPEDRGILLKDILETGTDLTQKDKSFCMTASYDGAVAWNTIERSQRSMVAEPVCVAQRGRYVDSGNRSIKTDAPTEQFYEARTDGKTNALTTVQKDNAVVEPVRVGDLPNGKGEIGGSQATRIYSTEGKSVNLVANGGGQGAKTGLYAIKVGELGNGGQGNRIYSVYGKAVTQSATSGGIGSNTGLYAIPIEFKGSVPTRAISCADGKEYPVYEVKEGQITIRDKQYPIKLQDGFYIIRKLTVVECCRLQGMPDWWFDDIDGNKLISATQCYKGLGNGWQKDTVKYILSHLPIDRNEEILCLSMYDGIGTGRRILEELGFTNVKYVAYEIDSYCTKVTSYRYPDIIHRGDAFQVREEGWSFC